MFSRRQFLNTVAASTAVGAMVTRSTNFGEPSASSKPFLEKSDLFEAKEGGYFIYRIPGIVITPKGAILAYAEARKITGRDWDEIDIVYRRSTDGGRTFSPQKVLVNAFGQTGNNPVMIADRETGDIHFLYCIDYKRCYYQRSTDDGNTFGEPVEVTKTFQRYVPEYRWSVIASGAGHGIQLQSGRLVVPVWLSNGGGFLHLPAIASAIYSDDHGLSWQRGDIVPDTIRDMSEGEAVQLSAGRVLLNMRNEAGERRRAFSYSNDGAHGWTKPVFQSDLVEPSCMGSTISVPRQSPSQGNLLLFTIPENLSSESEGGSLQGRVGVFDLLADRINLTVRLSSDEGASWPVSRTLDPGISGYSDLAMAADQTIYCLYERGDFGEGTWPQKYLTLAHFNLDWITGGKDQVGR